MNVNAADDTKLCVREGSDEGKVIACLNITKSSEWGTQEADLEYVPKGVIDLVVTNEGEGAVSVDWVKFVNSDNKKDKDKEKEKDSSEADDKNEENK